MSIKRENEVRKNFEARKTTVILYRIVALCVIGTFGLVCLLTTTVAACRTLRSGTYISRVAGKAGDVSYPIETILIERLADGGFNVRVGNRDTERLAFDEMLGAVIALTMPPEHQGRISRWLQTPEEREAEEQRRDQRRRIREQPALTDLRGL